MAEALSKAVMRGDVEAVKKLLEEGADPSALNKKGMSALHVAAREGDPDVLGALLESPAIFINNKDRDSGFTPLLHAVLGCQGDPTIVKQILSVKGCDIAATDTDKSNALHWAALLGQTEVAALLLNRGIQREATNAAGDTPLHVALKEGNEETALLLLQRGACPNTKDSHGSTPLHVALSNGLLSVAVNIISSKKFSSGGCVDADGNTPLHIAAEEGLSSVVKMLQDAGFSMEAPNFAGLTPATMVEMRQRQQEEEKERRSAALRERGERKKQQAAAAMQQTEVTAFCVAAALPEAVQEVFFKKRFLYVDEAFLNLDETALRKMGLGATERLFFKEAVERFRREKRQQEENEAAQLKQATDRQRLLTRIVACIVLTAAVVMLYLALEFVVYRQRR